MRMSPIQFTIFENVEALNTWHENVVQGGGITIIQLQYNPETSEHYVYYAFKTPDRSLSFLRPY